jgi:hypothetical protein
MLQALFGILLMCIPIFLIIYLVGRFTLTE